MKKYKTQIISLVAIPIVGFMSIHLDQDNSSAFDDIVTFLSIIIGFTITALSIIASSKISQELYNKELKNNNSKTLLQELVDEFKYSTFLFTFVIALVLLYQFNEDNLFSFYVGDNLIKSKSILRNLIWYLTIISFAEFGYLFRLFSKLIIKGVAKK